MSVVATLDVVPALLLLLPAAQGGLTLSFGVYASLLHAHGAGIWQLIPDLHSDAWPAALAIVLTVALSSAVAYRELATSGAACTARSAVVPSP